MEFIDVCTPFGVLLVIVVTITMGCAGFLLVLVVISFYWGLLVGFVDFSSWKMQKPSLAKEPGKAY